MIYICKHCRTWNRLPVTKSTTRAMRLCRGCNRTIEWQRKRDAKGRPGALVNKKKCK